MSADTETFKIAETDTETDISAEISADTDTETDNFRSLIITNRKLSKPHFPRFNCSYFSYNSMFYELLMNLMNCFNLCFS